MMVDLCHWDLPEWPAGCVTTTPDLRSEQGKRRECFPVLVIDTHSGLRWSFAALVAQEGWWRPVGHFGGVLGRVWY